MGVPNAAYVDGPKAASLFVFGLALRDPTPLLRESVGGTGSGRSSVVAEPAWWVNCLEFTELDIADRLQRIGQRTILQVGRQRVQPFGILSLQRSQLADGVRPTPGAAAMVGRATHADHRRVGRARGTVTGLALGIGHGSLT